MTTDRPCKALNRIQSELSDAVLIAGMRTCRVGTVVNAISPKIRVLLVSCVEVKSEAIAEAAITKI